MRLETERYETCSASNEELSVLAAFMKLPFLYGVSDRWMKSGYGDLRSKVRRVVNQMELEGKLSVEPSGITRTHNEFISLLTIIQFSEKVARFAIGTEHEKEVYYFYVQGQEVAFLYSKGHGMFNAGIIHEAAQFKELLKEAPKETDCKNEWFGALLMEKHNGLFEKLVDVAWKEESADNYMDCWGSFCDAMFQEKDGN